MEMVFTYKDFKKNYLESKALCPVEPFKPLEILNYVDFVEQLTAKNADDSIRDAFDQFRKRMGDDYFARFKRVQSRAEAISQNVFPPYKLLFLDITCEDWLSLVDFHKGFSRDHSIHQPLTAYIVCKLLGKGDPNESFKINGQPILKKAAEVIMTGPNALFLRQRLKLLNPGSKLLSLEDPNLWMSVFYQTAIITAMYHDLGYPWQFIENMHESLNDYALLCGSLKKGDTRIDECINEHKDKLMLYPFYDYGRGGKTADDIDKRVFEEALRNTHGLPGALAFAFFTKKYNIRGTTTNSEEIRFCQEWTSLAILMHDMAKIYKRHSSFPRLDFSVDPLSYIIALADTLEDFNRPNAEIYPNAAGCRIKYVFPSLDVKFEEDGKGNASITYSIVPENRVKQEEYKKNDENNLFNTSSGYFELSSIGLKKVEIKCI